MALQMATKRRQPAPPQLSNIRVKLENDLVLAGAALWWLRLPQSAVPALPSPLFFPRILIAIIIIDVTANERRQMTNALLCLISRFTDCNNLATAPCTVTSAQRGVENEERRRYSERINGDVSILWFAQQRMQAATMADVVSRAARPDHGGDRRHWLDPLRPRRPASRGVQRQSGRRRTAARVSRNEAAPHQPDDAGED